MPEYSAYLVEETENGFQGSVSTLNTDNLPAGELLVKVEWSSLNFKDMLSASGNRAVTKEYPHTPGIDAAGTVVESASGEFGPGDSVIVTSYDLGMNTPGGFGRYIRVPAAWAVPLPAGLALRESMALGTAGLTAGICVKLLAERVDPGDGEVAVTGASGGVGMISIALLNKLGYRVVAVSGTAEAAATLTGLGAAEIAPRETLEDDRDRPLFKGRFAGGIDTVGGEPLAALLKSVAPLGAVSCCGNAASGKLELTVYPFILRGIQLSGVSTQNYPMQPRREIWNLLADEWRVDLEPITAATDLAGLDAEIRAMRDGRHSGRTIVGLSDA